MSLPIWQSRTSGQENGSVIRPARSLKSMCPIFSELGYSFLAGGLRSLSVPFGLAIALIGIAFMLRRRPRLPEFIHRTRIEFKILQRVIPFVARLMERLERYIKPRMTFLVKGPVMTSLFGLGIVSGGF